MLTLGRLSKFQSQIEPILIEYYLMKGSFPRDINDLDEFEQFKEAKKWRLFPVKQKFGLKSNIINGEFVYTFYSFGLDGDDDDLIEVYSPNLSYAFIPVLAKNGDIILKKGQLANKSIDNQPE